jgi:hypothetical protein
MEATGVFLAAVRLDSEEVKQLTIFPVATV